MRRRVLFGREYTVLFSKELSGRKLDSLLTATGKVHGKKYSNGVWVDAGEAGGHLSIGQSKSRIFENTLYLEHGEAQCGDKYCGNAVEGEYDIWSEKETIEKEMRIWFREELNWEGIFSSSKINGNIAYNQLVMEENK